MLRELLLSPNNLLVEKFQPPLTIYIVLISLMFLVIISGSVPSLSAQKFNSSSFVEYIQLCGNSPSNPCPSPDPYAGQGAPSETLASEETLVPKT
ncbi:hypothetical protein MtrunA17_Chr5g0419021 [Medicago truncatula]|nr:hypothetical protein MtrunA17_Chr5g0419021 [Medicago truncatula]